MSSYKRKDPRTSLGARAILRFGSGRSVPCLVLDVSKSGAQVQLEEQMPVPARFILVLDEKAGVLRLCELVWQEGTKIGCRFNHRALKDIQNKQASAIALL